MRRNVVAACLRLHRRCAIISGSRSGRGAAISQQPHETSDDSSKPQETSNPLEWKSFNMRAVVSATEDLFQFILSDKGFRVRLFLVRDIINTANIFLQDGVTASIFYETTQGRERLETEVHSKLTRVVNGFRYLRQAVKLAPDVWTSMLIRLALKPEIHKFSFDIISALLLHANNKVPETLWVCMSRLLNEFCKDWRSP